MFGKTKLIRAKKQSKSYKDHLLSDEVYLQILHNIMKLDSTSELSSAFTFSAFQLYFFGVWLIQAHALLTEWKTSEPKWNARRKKLPYRCDRNTTRWKNKTRMMICPFEHALVAIRWWKFISVYKFKRVHMYAYTVHVPLVQTRMFI